MKNAESPEPVTKGADSKKPAKTATTKATPHNSDNTGVATVRPTTPEARGRHGHRRPYGTAISRPARHCSHASLNVIHDRRPYGPRAAGPFSQRGARRRPGLPQSAKGVAGPPEAGYPLPRSMRHIKETRRGKATVRALEAAHCSHAYFNEALVIRGEATVSSRRQDPRRWGRPVDQEAGSRRDPPVGGPQQPAEKPAEKPASVDTDGWDQCPAGLQLYPRG